MTSGGKQDYQGKGQALIINPSKAVGNSGLVYKDYLQSRNQYKLEEDFGVQKVMMGFDASWWMHCFSWVLMALLFLEIFQCLGRPNYGNAVLVFGIFLAILLDMRDESEDHTIAKWTLRGSIVAIIALLISDIWYLVAGTIVVLE